MDNGLKTLGHHEFKIRSCALNDLLCLCIMIRVLIAQAEEAAKALEAAAMKDKSALAPLLETRRLLAEAVRSIESTSGGQYRKPLNIRDGNQGQR